MTDPHRYDRDLVTRVLQGEEQALDVLVDEYYPRLYRFAYPRLGSDPEATQDVVQGTFEKVIQKLDYYRAEAPLFSWLCTFCRYEITSHWKRLGRSAPEVELIEDRSEIRAALESLAALDDTPEQLLERQELGRLVRVTLDFLPVHYGNVLELKYIHGLSVREAAEKLQMTPKAVESMLTRARSAFRDGFAALMEGLAP